MPTQSAQVWFRSRSRVVVRHEIRSNLNKVCGGEKVCGESGTGAVLNLTLKAFANSSPGLRFGNPGKEGSFFADDANPERVASRYLSQLLQSCDKTNRRILPPGFQSKPWAGN
jgi:hypothetical protein